jgi:hypothetical protein
MTAPPLTDPTKCPTCGEPLLVNLRNAKARITCRRRHRVNLAEIKLPEEHEGSVMRAQIVEAGRSAGPMVVSRFQADVAAIVSAARLGQEGLITQEMVKRLGQALELLEGEL